MTKEERHALRARIQKQDLRMWWVAEQIGVTKSSLRRWLSGHIKTPRLEHMEALMKLLGEA